MENKALYEQNPEDVEWVEMVEKFYADLLDEVNGK